jgi:multimeric flavodoxin WrbA
LYSIPLLDKNGLKYHLKLLERGLKMATILAIYGSPRRKGNTSLLLQKAVEGACEAGAQVEEVVLRDLKMSPCLEIYGCKKTGRCVIKDDFQKVYDQLLACQGLILASPIFFYAVSAHTKILMDRCQSLWVKRYWIEKVPFGKHDAKRKGLFISVGATKGKKLFDGVQFTVRYFFDALDAELWKSLLYRGLDFEGDVLEHPEYLEEAYLTGRELAYAIENREV